MIHELNVLNLFLHTLCTKEEIVRLKLLTELKELLFYMRTQLSHMRYDTCNLSQIGTNIESTCLKSKFIESSKS